VTPTLAMLRAQFAAIRIGIASLWRSKRLPWVYLDDGRVSFDVDIVGIERHRGSLE
jgi:hypothetical protein